jgi:hypothetical protein
VAPHPDINRSDLDRLEQLNQRLRRQFFEGAEEESRQRLGRGLTDVELARVLRRYRGDLAECRAQDSKEHRLPGQ